MDRRNLLKGTAGALAASALAPGTARAGEAGSCGRAAKSATFLIAHGAWSGAGLFDQMAKILRDRGHVVHVPSLSGTGEKAHVRPTGINVDTHVEDLLSVIRFSDLDDFVLVGHSYGGMVITGVADRVPEKIRSIVYLDAFIPEDGQAVIDTGVDPEQLEYFRTLRKRGHELVPIPPEFVEAFGLPEDQMWRFPPQPIGCFVDPVSLSGRQHEIPKKTFVLTNHRPGFVPYYERLQADPAWRTATIDTEHDLMTEKPETTAQLLEAAI